jgi:uncharacterized protein
MINTSTVAAFEVPSQKGQRFRRNDRFLSHLEESREIRLSLMVDATTACQMRCRYCYFGDKGHEMMDVTRILSAAINLSGVFGKKLTHINFHYMGGEPLMAWQSILELNSRAREAFGRSGVKFDWSLTSNLVGLDERKADHMLAEKANIHCSIDGPADIQNRNRPLADGRPSYNEVARNVRYALRVTPSDVARVTVCPEDTRNITRIVDSVLAMGFHTVGLFPAYNMGWADQSIRSWADNITATFSHRDFTKGRPKVSTIVKPLERPCQPKRFSYCGAGKSLWALDVRGRLYFCHHLTRNSRLSVIDASRNSPDKIRMSIERSPLPPSYLDLSARCKECPARHSCHGGCWAENLLANGNANVPEKIECEMRRATAVSFKRLTKTSPMLVGIKPSLRTRGCFISDNNPRCETCQNCYSCQNCQNCNTCEGCNKGCQVCDTCQSCNHCNDCQSRCESTCQGCDSCQSCDASEYSPPD